MPNANTRRNAWRRLRRNKGALFGMAVIGLAVLVALFGYWIAPDHSPYANRMVLEIGGKKPGYTQLFLKLPRKERPTAPGIFSWMLYGKPENYDYIPVESVREQGNDSLQVIKYIDEDLRDTVLLAQNSIPGYNKKTNLQKQTFYLGTDKYGRDILSRLIIGVRVSLGVGLITVLISLSIGVLLGAVAGYFGGRVDEMVMWLINVLWSIPTLLLVFAITLMLGKGFWQVFIAIGLTMWVNVARLVRGQVLAIRELEYVEAARALGYADRRIIIRHILPNIMGPVMVLAASNFASAIIIEAGLSFLGIGVQPPQPSWGLMIKENYNFIITHNPMLALVPGFAIMLLVLAFNMLGNGLRDALSVKD
ncbi:MAG TPA: ABC transporter permease [Chitinophagaceae bacterium]|nr:ABC transporter permease [Chitinophagaceae bacterium]